MGSDRDERHHRDLPVGLRTLDLIHLAAALALGDDLAAVLTYDHRMAEAARARSVEVVAPS